MPVTERVETAARTSGPVLACRDVGVRFGDVVVLEDVCLDVYRGERHVLIGPNGAGKTTLVDVVTGHAPMTNGTITLEGRPLTGRPWRRARRGVGRKFQTPRVFGRLTSGHNLQVTDRYRPSAEDRAELGTLAAARADELSHGWRQWLELRMVLAQCPALIVLDEPTAGMTPAGRAELAKSIRDFGQDTTFLIVEHDLAFVARIADRVSFLHEGRLALTGTFEQVREAPIVRAAYAGSGPQ